VIDAEEDDVSRIKQLIETGSLFAKRKLIVVKYALSSGKGFAELALIAKRMRTDVDTLVIAWDCELVKEGMKRLAELKLSKEEVLHKQGT
jgi:DNA polymerase III delta subunit